MNRDQPHVYILPEDDADSALANGFSQHVGLDTRRLQILRTAGGWRKVVEAFHHDWEEHMQATPLCRIVLLIDFDEQADRREAVAGEIPADLAERVYVIGVWSDPEQLRSAVHRKLEDIGQRLAEECRSGSAILWDHELLSHNADELARMSADLKPILFGT